MERTKIVALVLLGIFSTAYGSCKNPKITPSTFSTTDAFFHTSTTFIVEFLLACDNDVNRIPLHAEVNGRLMPAAISEETGKYQVSWTEEHDKAHGGAYTCNIYDEDGYSALRKAQRNGEDVSKVKPLGSATIQHPGPSKGQLVTSESVILGATMVLFYFAYSWKSAIQS